MNERERDMDGETPQSGIDPFFVQRFAQLMRPGVVPLDIPRRIFSWVAWLDGRNTLAKEIARRRVSTAGALVNSLPIVHPHRRDVEKEKTAKVSPGERSVEYREITTSAVVHANWVHDAVRPESTGTVAAEKRTVQANELPAIQTSTPASIHAVEREILIVNETRIPAESSREAHNELSATNEIPRPVTVPHPTHGDISQTNESRIAVVTHSTHDQVSETNERQSLVFVSTAHVSASGISPTNESRASSDWPRIATNEITRTNESPISLTAHSVVSRAHEVPLPLSVAASVEPNSFGAEQQTQLVSPIATPLTPPRPIDESAVLGAVEFTTPPPSPAIRPAEGEEIEMARAPRSQTSTTAIDDSSAIELVHAQTPSNAPIAAQPAPELAPEKPLPFLPAREIPLSTPIANPTRVGADVPDASGRYIMPAVRRRPRARPDELTVTPRRAITEDVPLSIPTSKQPKSLEAAAAQNIHNSLRNTAMLTAQSSETRRVTTEESTIAHVHVVRATRVFASEEVLPRVMPKARAPADESNISELPRVHQNPRNKESAPSPIEDHGVFPGNVVIQPKDSKATKTATAALPHVLSHGQTSASSAPEEKSKITSDKPNETASSRTNENVQSMKGGVEQPSLSSASAAVDIDVLAEKVQRKILRRFATEWERKGSLR